jgi:hypothetical protein
MASSSSPAARKVSWEIRAMTAYLLTDHPSTGDGRPVHRPVPSSVVREAVPPYRRRTVHWTAVFDAVRRPGQTVTIPIQVDAESQGPQG